MHCTMVSIWGYLTLIEKSFFISQRQKMTRIAIYHITGLQHSIALTHFLIVLFGAFGSTFRVISEKMAGELAQILP